MSKNLGFYQDIVVFINKVSYVSKSGVRLFPYWLLAYIMPPLYKR